MNEKTESKKTSENYTDEMTEALRDGYDPEASEATRTEQMEELAHKVGKSVASVRSKLVRMKLYVKKEYVKKTGDKPETKETIVADMARELGVDADTSLAGLEKATKNCLILLRGTIKAAAAAVAAESES